MTDDPIAAGSAAESLMATHPVSPQWKLVMLRFFRHRMAVFSLVLLGVLAVASYGANFFAPASPTEQDLSLGSTPPSSAHWFGTDVLGRDQLSRMMFAGRITLTIGLAVAILATVIGTVLGSLAGYWRGKVDMIIARSTDVFLVLPAIAVLAVALGGRKNDITLIIIFVAAFSWMTTARVVRGIIFSLREREFIDAARVSGDSSFRIIVRHMLPNMVGPIVVNVTLGVAIAIIIESTLSFLGFGVQPPQASWGSLLSDARALIRTDKSYLVYIPGALIVLTVLAINFIGDGLRDAFDPQSEKH